MSLVKLKTLEPDMVPLQFNWRRSHPLTSKGWGVIRKEQLARTNGTCEFCGNPGKIIHHEYEYHIIDPLVLGDISNSKPPWPVHYQITRFVTEFVVSCYRCNEVLHYVWASNTARSERALSWIMKIRNFSEAQARQLVLEKVNLWVQRSKLVAIYGEADRFKLLSDGHYIDTFTGQEVR